jgi:elongation factor 4
MWAFTRGSLSLTTLTRCSSSPVPFRRACFFSVGAKGAGQRPRADCLLLHQAFGFPRLWLQRGFAQKQKAEQEEAPAADLDLAKFTPPFIRNFCIISHIDHGKTTMSTRLMERAGTISLDKEGLYLDKLQVEKERGITVRAHTTSLTYKHSDGHPYLLNLIDTPGHVDFTYEVSRSLAACQGALLLVDCTQGIQAQTVANYFLAFEANLKIIPVLNKIDLPTSEPARVARELVNIGFEEGEILKASGKTGEGVDSIFEAVIQRLPPPSGDPSKPLKALLFENWYDQFRGVVCLINVLNGSLKKGDKVVAASSNKVYELENVGILFPERVPTGALYTGQVGYIIGGMRSTKEARVGDTLYHEGTQVEPLPGFKPAKPMVFAGLYPADGETLDRLTDAFEKLTLNDASVIYQKERSDALGMGFRCGFLGLLHMDVFLERLEQEYDIAVIATAPTVPYLVEMKDGTTVAVNNPSLFPPQHNIMRCSEPVAEARIIAPKEYLSPLLRLCLERRGVQEELSYIDDSRVHLRYRIPLSELITDFNDNIKGITSGFATFDYEEAGYEETDLVKVEALLNGQPVEALSGIFHRSKAVTYGKDLVQKLRKAVKRQLYEVAIQASVDGKIVARETLQALRKDVTAKCYGGDITRKRKLLEKQKEGKKRMKTIGNVQLPQEAFYGILKGAK